MEVFFNNNLILLLETGTLSDLLRMKQLFDTKGIAVAINNQVIPRSSWEETHLEEKDYIAVIKATQGG